MRIKMPGLPLRSAAAGTDDDNADAAPLAAPAAHTAGAAHVAHCFETLAAHFSGGEVAPPSFPDAACPLFVTWNKTSERSTHRGGWRLRGCIGTLAARPLHSALPEYALTAALRDRRFPPISPAEVPLLRCTVSLLHGFERASGWSDWQVGIHGLIINFADPWTGIARTATFLPDVAAAEGWSVVQTIEALVCKAGADGPLSPALRDSLQVTRYQATTHSLTYDEFAAAAALAEDVVAEPLQPGSPLVGAVPA